MPNLYLVEGYGGEVESRFIHVVAMDVVDAERIAREQLAIEYYPYLDANIVTEVGGYKIFIV